MIVYLTYKNNKVSRIEQVISVSFKDNKLVVDQENNSTEIELNELVNFVIV